MCGITGSLNVGAYGYSNTNARIQHAMLLASTLRGIDGTGIVKGPLDISDSVIYDKDAVAATEFMSRSDMVAMTRDARFIIAHTRAATLGGVAKEACHPFSDGPVIGVHNGTVHSIKSIFPDLEGINDSEIIYKALSKAEPDKAVDVLKELDFGAYALVWYDSRISSLRFARNEDRPLWFHKEGDMWWWASEPGTIASCLASAGLNPLAYMKCKPWQLDTHVLMTVPVDGGEAIAEAYSPNFTQASYRGGYYGTYGDLYGGDGDDFWNRYNGRAAGSVNNTSNHSNKITDGWVTIDSGDSLYGQPGWFTRYRTQVRGVLVRLLKGYPGRTSAEFTERMVELARRTDTVTVGSTSSPCIAFVAQHMNPVSGMCYGALDVEGFGPMPVVGKASDAERQASKAMSKDTASDKLPTFTATIDNLKVYHEGSIGMCVKDIAYMGTVPEESVSLTEEAVGSKENHPHLQAGTFAEAIDWSVWATKW